MPSFIPPVIGWNALEGMTEAALHDNGSIDAKAQTYLVDPHLPVLGRRQYGTFPQIVIPKFRFVGVKKTTRSATGLPVLTLATAGTAAGSNVQCLGINAQEVFQVGYTSRQSGYAPTIWRHKYYVYPYLPSINDANGALARGDSIAPDLYGRPVKYLRGGTYLASPTGIDNTTAGGSSLYPLANATSPVLQPRNISVWNVTQSAAETVDASTYGTAEGKWYLQVSELAVTRASDVLLVSYNYGHDAEDLVGRLVDFDVAYPSDDWIKWLRVSFEGGLLAPMAMPGLATFVDGEVVTITNDSGILANRPIDPIKPIRVYVDGVRESTGGIDMMYNGDLQGLNYVIDPLAGTIEFKTGYISGQTVTVDYWKVGDYMLGNQVWPIGIPGVMDGTQNVAMGIGFPPEYNVHPDGGVNAVGGLKLEAF